MSYYIHASIVKIRPSRVMTDFPQILHFVQDDTPPLCHSELEAKNLMPASSSDSHYRIAGNPATGLRFITAADTAKPRFQASLPQGSELSAAQVDELRIQAGS